MSTPIKKNLLITPGGYGTFNTTISQIDFKWYESGVGTFLFSRTSLDLRTSIYNWYDNEEPVLLFGGMGTIGSTRYFLSPYVDYVGGFSGISTDPYIKFYPIRGKIALRELSITNGIYDSYGNVGSTGQVLSSIFHGVAWTTVGTIGGSISAPQVAFGNGTDSIAGVSTFVYWQEKFGIGTSFPTVLLDVRGNANISGVTTSAFSGDGRLLTTLNASNLASGTVPTARVSGTYSGISSVGNLDQLSVSGISSFNAVYLRGSVRDLLNSQGSLGQILVSTGTGVAWSSVASTGVTTGTVADTQIAFGNGNNSLLGISTFVYWRNLVGIGTQYPTVLLDVRGDANISGVTTSAFSGDGRLLTTLNATNLASGTVPTARVSGSYSGISSVGNLDQLSVSGISSFNAVYLRGSVRDLLNSQGSLGQILVSTGTGVAWSSVASTGVTTGTVADTQIAFGNQNNSLLGVSTFVYWRNLVGIGTQYPTVLLDVRGDASISGVTTSAFSGDGRLLTALNASNLASGTVPTARISGSYSGISSVGNLDQLSVSGISSFNAVYLRGSVRDLLNSQGSLGQILVSTGTGVAWSSISATGVTTGAVGADQIAFGQGNNALLGVSTFVYWQNKVGIGTLFPNSLLDLRGDLRANNILLNGSVGRSIGLTTDSGNLIIFGSDSTTTQGYDLKIKAGNSSVTDEIGGDVYIYGGIADNAGSVIIAHTGVSQWGLVGIGGNAPTQLLDVFGSTRLRGRLYDYNNSTGVYGNILVSTTSGIAWSSVASTGVTTGTVADTQIAFGNGNNSLLGISTFVYWQNKVGIGTQYPTVLLDVRGDVSISGITTSAFSGDGRLLTALNASNLASGTVPTARISGSYSGISSVGNLDQLSVIGVTSLNALFLRNVVNDSTNGIGVSGQVLKSFGASGVVWSPAGGGATVTLTDTQIAFGDGSNSVSGISTFVYWRNKVGIGTQYPTVLLDVRGDVSISGVTTSAFSGDGRLLTTLNASNLASGTVPTARVSGSYAGISSVGNLDQLSVSGISSFNAVYLRGSVRDLLNSQGSFGQILVSTGTGIAWSSISATGVTTGTVADTQIAFGNGNNSLLGISTFVYWQNKVGIGIANPSVTLDVLGSASISGVTTSAFSGDGRLLTTLNASNLASGTVPTTRVSGSYSGISSVGNLDQLSVSGISSFNAVYLRGSVRDLLNSQGSLGQILVSTGTGVAWSSISATGVTTGAVGADQIAFGQGNNALLGVSTFVYWQNKVGIGTQYPEQILDVRGDSLINNITIGLGSWQHSSNTVVGKSALFYNLSQGQNNVIIGNNAANITTPWSTVGIGFSAFSGSAGFQVAKSVAIGAYAGQYINTGNDDVPSSANIAIGYKALQGSAVNIITGSENIAIGRDSGANITSGSFNIFIGSGAGNTGVAGGGSYQIGFGHDIRTGLSNMGAWGGNTNATRTDLGIGSWNPTARVHIETLNAANKGLYVAGYSGQTSDLLNIVATSNGGAYYVVVSATGSVGIGTSFPTALLDVRGSASISGVTTSAFSGDGRLLTTLNASNLASGTVPTARVSGSYSGISSVGNLDQLSVSGISSFNAVYLRGSVRDLLNSQGSLGQILVSTGTGVAWSSVASTGVTTGTVADTQIAFGNGNNSLLGISTFVYWQNKVGIGTVFPNALVDVRGDLYVNNILLNGSVGRSIGLTTNSGILTIFGSDSTTGDSGNVILRAGRTTFSEAFGGDVYIHGGLGDNAGDVILAHNLTTSWGLVGIGGNAPTQLLDIFGNTRIRGRLYDFNNSSGVYGNILVSTTSGIAWSSLASTGVTTGTVDDTQIAFGNGNNSLLGISTLVYWRNKVGIGTQYPTVLLDVRGDVSISGVTTSAFSGDGRLLTTLNASNLASGTVPSARVSGSYSGISSVGNLDQLSVSGISSFNAVYLRGSVRDLLNSQGSFGQILVSTGTGVAWSSVASTGVTTGIVDDTQIAFGNGNNSLLGISTLVYWRNKVGIGTQYPTVLLDVRGDASISGVTTSAFSGDGRLLTTLNASNLASGTVPSARVSGSYSGISSVGNLDQLSVIGVTSLNALFLRNVVNDSTNGIGVSGQVLKSFGASGVVWSPAGGGSVTLNDTQIAFGDGSNNVSGISTLVYWRNKVGIGTQYPTVLLDVRGDASISGVTTSAFSGDGRLLTTLNASNLASGTVPTARVSGSYSGISSVGNLDQLSVSGISSFNAVYLRGSVRDLLNSQGSLGQILVSTGTGVAWSSLASTGVTTGTVADTQIAFGNGNNSLLGISTFVYWQNKVGIGTVFPNALVDVRGDLYVNNILLNGSVGRSIGLTTNSGILTIFGSDSTTGDSGNVILRAGRTAFSEAFGGDVYIHGGLGDNAGDVILAHNLTTSWGLVAIGGNAPTQLLDVFGNTRIRGRLYDFNNSSGVYGNILVSTTSGIAWSSVASTGVTTGTVADTQIAFGNGNNSLLGISTLVYWRNLVGIGTQYPTVLLDVRGDVSISGVTTSAFSGDGRLLTTLNASNLASGTVPSARVSGSYSGISSVGNLDQLSVIGVTSLNALFLRNVVNDSTNGIGVSGQVLKSFGASGVVWSPAGGGSVTLNDTQIAFGDGSNNVSGISTLVYWRNKVGIGTQYPTVLLDVRGDVSISGVTTSAFSGDGRLLTTLNASNLASGTVPTARVSGSYSGISSVGNLDQLSVIGVTSLNAVFLRNVVHDTSGVPGQNNQILKSTGVGVTWANPGAGTGTIQGTIAATQVAFGNGADSIMGVSTLTYTGLGSFGIGVANASYALHVVGGTRITGNIGLRDSAVNDSYFISATRTETAATASIPLYISYNYTQSTHGGQRAYGLFFGVTQAGNITYTDTFGATGIEGFVQNSNTGVASGATGAVFYVRNTGVGTLQRAYGLVLNANENTGGGEVTNSRQLEISVGPTFNANNQTRIGIRIAAVPEPGTYTGTVAAAIQFNNTGYSPKDGLVWGSDTNLYRGRPNVLRTDDAFESATSVGVGTTATTQLHVQGNARISGGIFDSSANSGLARSVLVSTGTGIAWTNPANRSITFIFGDGVNPIGIATGYLPSCPFSGTIQSWSIIGDISGDVVIDIWKSGSRVPIKADSITASSKPSLSSQQINSSFTLTSWITSVNVDDLFAFEASGGTVDRATIILRVIT